MRYAFLYFNVFNGVFTGLEYEINCSYIRSYLKKNNIETEQIIYKKNNSVFSMHALLRHVVDKYSDYVLVFFINEYNYFATKAFHRHYKVNNYGVTVCIGANTDYIAKNLHSDIRFDLYIHSNPCDTIKYISEIGIESVHRNNIHSSQQSARIYGVDENIGINNIPHPYSSGVVPAEEVFNIGIYSSRGCVGQCCFCSYSYKCNIDTYRIDNLVSELQFIKSEVGNNSGTILFLDDCFSQTQDRIVEICSLIIQNELDYNYWCTTRADVLSLETLDLMRRANFSIVVGLESASPRLFASIGKATDCDASKYIEAVKEQYTYSVSIGLDYRIAFMYMLPGETIEDVMSNLDFIVSNNIKKTSLSLMTLFPRSRLFNTESAATLTRCSPQKLNVRTVFRNYNPKILYSILASTKAYNEQLGNTSRQGKIYVDFVEHLSGINSPYRISVTYHISSIDIDCIDETMLAFLERYTGFETRLFYSSNRISKGVEIFCDDRKHFKIEFDEFDRSIKYFYENNFYCEQLSFIMFSNDVYKLKKSNYFELSLDEINGISYESSAFVEEIVDKYFEFSKRSLHSFSEINYFIFRNSCALSSMCTILSNRRYSYSKSRLLLCGVRQVESHKCEKVITDLFGKREKKCKGCSKFNTCSRCPVFSDDIMEKICIIKKRCPLISEIVSTSAFIVKNFVENRSKVFISFHSINKQFYDNNQLPKSIHFIYDDYIGFFYNSQSRKNIILENSEISFLKMCLYQNKTIYSDKSLVSKIAFFIGSL